MRLSYLNYFPQYANSQVMSNIINGRMMKRFISYDHKIERVEDLIEEARQLRIKRYDLTLKIRGINKKIKELKDPRLICGCPKPDRFAMCIKQEHLSAE